VKLFQIEEPDGSPIDPDAPGMAIGIDAGGAQVEVAVAVGGNAVVLSDREGFEQDLTVPPTAAPVEAWQLLLEGARLRAERALAQPVTHAVVAVASTTDSGMIARLMAASEVAGLDLLRVVTCAELDPREPPALVAAILAEDLAPRPTAD
jgi:molecular chaperone DnaK (HSP70)